MATTLMQIRLDKNLKKDADLLFQNLGLDTTTAVRMFLKASLQKQGLPFKVQHKSKAAYKEEEAFYSPKNVAILLEGYKKLQNGEGAIKELFDE
ncbi:type II toxin-antitoxin system RelB/DinJ family antitoxin [uncultured Helicobacter sp.]|uniref:type II toxin-antitoxin system RelB/DinJ family antitoxin n=1 Tax=uncultured Helicobacter sp. TaxID=175537 RepID=UPI00374E9D47